MRGVGHFRFKILNNSAIPFPIFPLAFPSCQVLLAQNLAKKIQPFKRLNLSGILAELTFKSNLGKQRVAKLSPFLLSPCPATAQMQFRQSKTQSAENELSSKQHHKSTNGSGCFSAAPVVIFIMFRHFRAIAAISPSVQLYAPL